MTAKTSVNLATGKVLLGGVAEKYAGLVNAYFVDGSGTFDIVPTKEAINTMDNDKIKAMVTDILVHSNLGHRTDSIAVKAGGESHEFSGSEDFVSLAREAQAAKERVAAEAKAAAEAEAQQKQTEALKTTAQDAISKNVTDEFLDQVIVRGLKTNDTSVNYEGIALEALKSGGVNVPDGPEEQIYKAQLAEKLKARLETYGIKDGVGSSPAYLAAKAITDNTLSLPEGNEATKLQQIAKAVELAANSKDLSSDVRTIAALRVAGLNAQNTAAMITAIREKGEGSVTLDDKVTNAVMALANDNQLTEEAFKSALGAIDLAPAAQVVDETPQEESWDFDIDAFQAANAAKEKQSLTA
jgi:hypothetical protein